MQAFQPLSLCMQITPSYPRSTGAKKETGRSPDLWSLLAAPSHTFCTVDSQLAPIYSGGTVLDFHQLPYCEADIAGLLHLFPYAIKFSVNWIIHEILVEWNHFFRKTSNLLALIQLLMKVSVQ
jgi:hypothetical protein